MNIKEQVLNYREDILRDLAKLVSFNSVMDTTSEYPFGEENYKCLTTALNMFKEAGMKVSNLDNYCGYGEIGTGDKLIGVLGHLDVVPAGENWNTDPFTMTIKDNKIFGRGVSDDKGPMVCAFYALKVIMDNNIPLNKRIRIVVGSNEENGSKCLDYYVSKEGHIDYGFTPDASFPGIHGEKGMIGGSLNAKTTKIKNIRGGVAGNVVCNKVEFSIANSDLCLNKFKETLEANNIKYDITEGDLLDITVYGIAGHASVPTSGINAMSYAMDALEKANCDDNFVKYYNSVVALTTDGSQAKIDCTDNYGPLTFNIGVIKQKDDVISASIDIRFPVTLKGNDVLSDMKNKFNTELGYLGEMHISEPLFFDPEHPMIKALVKSYQTVTNDLETKPCVIGGGTYSRHINNCIAFGGDIGNVDHHIHDANEFLDIDDLLVQTEIYVHAILNLLEL